MVRRTLAAALVLVLALPALVSSREPPRPRVDRCADDGGRTLVASRWVRVYVRRDRLDNEYLRYCWVRLATPRRWRGPDRRGAGREAQSVREGVSRKDTRSLAISGRRIFWMNGDTPRTAVLDGRASTAVCP